MSQGERTAAMCGWCALVVFISVFYFTGGFVKSTIAAIFVLVSGAIGFGRRWILRGGFLVSVLALAVYLRALPHPEEWTNHLKSAQAFVVSLAR
jgi:hypothetical protein